MNVRQAVAAMVKNPTIGFPWEPDVITLVNSFLPMDGQLDPATVQAVDVEAAIQRLDPSVQDMVYNATLDSTPAAAAVPPIPSAPLPSSATFVDKYRKDMPFYIFAFACMLVILLSATRIIDIAQFLDILKLLAQVVMSKDGGSGGDPTQ